MAALCGSRAQFGVVTFSASCEVLENPPASLSVTFITGMSPTDCKPAERHKRHYTSNSLWEHQTVMLITAIREHAQYNENARDVSTLLLDKR